MWPPASWHGDLAALSRSCDKADRRQRYAVVQRKCKDLLKKYQTSPKSNNNNSSENDEDAGESGPKQSILRHRLAALLRRLYTRSLLLSGSYEEAGESLQSEMKMLEKVDKQKVVDLTFMQTLHLDSAYILYKQGHLAASLSALSDLFTTTVTSDRDDTSTATTKNSRISDTIFLKGRLLAAQLFYKAHHPELAASVYKHVVDNCKHIELMNDIDTDELNTNVVACASESLSLTLSDENKSTLPHVFSDSAISELWEIVENGDLQATIDLCETLHQTETLPETFYNLGSLMLAQGKPRAAAYLLREALLVCRLNILEHETPRSELSAAEIFALRTTGEDDANDMFAETCKIRCQLIRALQDIAASFSSLQTGEEKSPNENGWNNVIQEMFNQCIHLNYDASSIQPIEDNSSSGEQMKSSNLQSALKLTTLKIYESLLSHGGRTSSSSLSSSSSSIAKSTSSSKFINDTVASVMADLVDENTTSLPLSVQAVCTVNSVALRGLNEAFDSQKRLGRTTKAVLKKTANALASSSSTTLLLDRKTTTARKGSRSSNASSSDAKNSEEEKRLNNVVSEMVKLTKLLKLDDQVEEEEIKTQVAVESFVRPGNSSPLLFLYFNRCVLMLSMGHRAQILKEIPRIVADMKTEEQSKNVRGTLRLVIESAFLYYQKDILLQESLIEGGGTAGDNNNKKNKNKQKGD
eukprot:g293.t1